MLKSVAEDLHLAQLLHVALADDVEAVVAGLMFLVSALWWFVLMFACVRQELHGRLLPHDFRTGRRIGQYYW